MNTEIPTNKRNIVNSFILGMGIAYSLFLVWAILYKCGAFFIGDGSERIINLIPFNNNTNWEMQFNIAVFIPFGFYFSAVKRDLTLIKHILAMFLASVTLEVIQFVLAVGRSDITDLLMNTLGGIMGIAAFFMLAKLLSKHERKVTFAICVLLTILEIYMAVSFIFFGQLNIGFMIIKL